MTDKIASIVLFIVGIFAIAVAFVSKLAFIFLTFFANVYTNEIRQVALIDVGAILLLMFVAALHFFPRPAS